MDASSRQRMLARLTKDPLLEVITRVKRLLISKNRGKEFLAAVRSLVVHLQLLPLVSFLTQARVDAPAVPDAAMHVAQHRSTLASLM